MLFRESFVLNVDIKAFLKEHNQNRIGHTCHWVAMGSSHLGNSQVPHSHLEPSQLVTEQVLALLVTFEGAREVQIHLSLHVL